MKTNIKDAQQIHEAINTVLRKAEVFEALLNDISLPALVEITIGLTKVVFEKTQPIASSESSDSTVRETLVFASSSQEVNENLAMVYQDRGTHACSSEAGGVVSCVPV